jgi:hypothetical protein
MRAWWTMVAVAMGAGCGFRVTVSSDDASMIDAAEIDAAEIDAMPTDAMPDAGWLASDCPQSYIQIGASPTRYALHTTAMNVFDHHELCEDDGTHLAVIQTAQEAAALKQFIDGTSGLPTTQFGPLVWVGAAQRRNQTNPTSGWMWATGSQTVMFWESGEPNDGFGTEDGQEEFGAIWRGNNLLADMNENTNLAGLCECDGAPVVPTYESLVDDGDNKK